MLRGSGAASDPRMPADPPAPTTERVALVVATLSSFLTPFMGASANVALPSMARDLVTWNRDSSHNSRAGHPG